MIPSLAEVEALLHGGYIAEASAGLRDEDRRKALEVTALLAELARVGRRDHLVDAAAGKAYVGLLAVKTGIFQRATVLERDAARVGASRDAARALGVADRVEVVAGDVADAAAWPAEADAVAALHACGRASDDIITALVRLRPRWAFILPCCYAADVARASRAEQLAAAAGMQHHPQVRRRLVEAYVDAERTLRLEAAGYQATVIPLVPPTVTPHHLCWRARFMGPGPRAERAAAALAALRA